MDHRQIYEQMVAGQDRQAAERHQSAEARGWKLLKENLSEEQLNRLERSGYFAVTGGTTGLLYHIRTGRTFNVDILGKAGQCGTSICFQPEGGLCTGDVMLTQKLALELREEEALRTANIEGTMGAKWLEEELRRAGFPDILRKKRTSQYNTLRQMLFPGPF